MTDYPRYIHRTVKASPEEYERQLSQALLAILSRSTHDLPGIIRALNESAVKPPGGGAWTDDNFVALMERLGEYPNSTGAALGAHPAGIIPPGNATPERPAKKAAGGRGNGE